LEPQLAPTGKARDALQEKGIPSETLQLHLVRARGEDRAAQAKTLYILDEASLASTKQIRAFLDTLGIGDLLTSRVPAKLQQRPQKEIPHEDLYDRARNVQNITVHAALQSAESVDNPDTLTRWEERMRRGLMPDPLFRK
jgi:hypothetical protein